MGGEFRTLEVVNLGYVLRTTTKKGQLFEKKVHPEKILATPMA